MAKQTSLGVVSMPDRTIEHDFAMLTKFQEYSAELLRLALLGISAIGLGVSQVLFGKPEEMPVLIAQWPSARWWLIGSLVAFTLAAFAALFHRYVSSDSLSWHLQAMRRLESGDPQHLERAKTETEMRYRKFRLSKISLRAAATGLAIGAATLSLALVSVIW